MQECVVALEVYEQAMNKQYISIAVIQKKALKIIGEAEDTALRKYAISQLSHLRTVAATTVLFNMHTENCPEDLKALLPPPDLVCRTTRRARPSHALNPPKSKTKWLGRSFLHSAVTT